MKRTHCLAALLAALIPAAFTPSCSSSGELVVVIQTDMELPKDVDYMKLEVVNAGIVRHADEYKNLGQTGGLKLPATIGIVKPDNGLPVTIRVIARRGGQLRVLREATTTVPDDRIVTFDMPFSFLCEDRASEDAEGRVSSDCGEGMTCLAGDCVAIEIKEPPQTPYDEGEVFGGGSGKNDGTCFDVTGCMDGGALASPDGKPSSDGSEGEICSVAVDPAAGDINVALLTETAGMCGPDGCLVPLDAQTKAGWSRSKTDPGTIELPAEVCRQLGKKVRGVMIAPLKPGCPLKEVRTPTCGPWSSVGSTPSAIDASPIAHASGQHNPSSLALTTTEVLWTSRGLFNGMMTQESDGAVKSAPLKPGTVRVLNASKERSARDIAVGGGYAVWTTASALGGKGEVWRAKLDGSEAAAPITGVTAENPEGVAANGSRVFWTEFTSGTVKSVPFAGGMPQVVGSGGLMSHPYRVVADDSVVCWTNEGSITMPDGSVECAPENAQTGVVTTLVASGLATPRAIALDQGVLYWATFAESGQVWRASSPLSGAAVPEMVAEGLSFANGIAIDENHIYISAWGDGGIYRLAKGAPAGSAPEKIASGQRKPAEIALTDEHIYWVNEGSVLGNTGAAEGGEALLVGDGAIMRMLKAK